MNIAVLQVAIQLDHHHSGIYRSRSDTAKTYSRWYMIITGSNMCNISSTNVYVCIYLMQSHCFLSKG